MLRAFGLLLLSAPLALSAQPEPDPSGDPGPDPFAFLAEDTRPLATRHAVDYYGYVNIGTDYTSDENFTFGQYNGRNEDEAKLRLDVDITTWDPEGQLGRFTDYWRVRTRDLGSDVRQGYVEFGKVGDYTALLGYDQQLQVRNDSGRTPFIGGGENLVLPSDWVASNITSGMTLLTSSSREFDQEVERKRFDLGFAKQFGPAWDVALDFSTEQKTGTQTLGGALYVDGSNGHAAILPKDLDATTNKLELSGGYATDQFTVNLEYLYSDYDNDNNALTWDNPYDGVFGPGIDYPGGRGSVAYEPDNEMQRLRGFGSYVFSPKLRFTVDGSFAKTEQDTSFLPFTVNALNVTEAVPRSNLDGEIETRTFDGRAYYRPLPRLSLEANYHFEERNNDGPRDGYLYVRGDAWAPDDAKFTVYNTTHDRTVNRVKLKGSYRLPRATRLGLEYVYDEVERSNAAVEKTEEDRYIVTLRTRIIQNLTGRLEVEYADRAADTYQWGQSFFALLDTRLINEIPDNQRYITHPELSQYYLANREQWQARLNLNYALNSFWNLSLDANYQDADFDKSELGLTEQKLTHVTLGGQWTPNADYSVSVFYSYDRYEAEQGGRSFRGGAEKNAFETFPPLPQASDPSRNWTVEPEDTTQSIGVEAQWTAIPDRLDLNLSYHYTDSEGSEDFTTFGAPDILGTPLPDMEATQHDLSLRATYHYTEQMSFDAEYRYYSYERDDWALDGVGLDSIDKVVSLGEANPDDDVSFFLLSVKYRLRE